jgi:hypothetical protein
MRASLLTQSTLFLAIALTACSSTVIGGGVGGGGGDLPAGSSSSGVITTSSGSIGTSSGGCSNPTPVGLPSAPCTPTTSICGASSSVCLATAHAHGAPQFGLRMAHIELTAPKSFTFGIVKSVFQSSATPNAPVCNFTGTATFNWLLRFDTTAGTLVTGAAKPVPDPSLGYGFVTGPVPLGGLSFDIAPLTLSASLDSTCGVTTNAGDVRLPFYGDAAGNTFTILPLRSLRFFDTTVTPDHDCIGSYNATALSPSDACQPDDLHPLFVDGGHFESFISLEEADQILVGPLSETLCLLLTSDPANLGTGGSPNKCKRDAGNQIVFKGDWCSATNQPASGGCADAVRFAGSFAASGVAIQ